MPNMQIRSVSCLSTTEYKKDEIYFMWAYGWGLGSDVFVGTYNGGTQLREDRTAVLNREIIDDWSALPHGIMYGVLAVIEQDFGEDFNRNMTSGYKLRQARRVENYINSQIDAYNSLGHPIGITELRTFLHDGIERHKVNDIAIGTCPLIPGTHDIRGHEGHYQVVLVSVQ